MIYTFVFLCLDTAVHTIEDTSFWKWLIVNLSSWISDAYFTNTLLFHWFNFTSTYFSYEKTIYSSCKLDLIKMSKYDICIPLFEKLWNVGAFSVWGRKLEINFDNGPDWFLIHFYQICQFTYEPFWISADALVHNYYVFSSV